MAHDGKTADLTIHHGAAPKASKTHPFPDRPQTTHTIPAKHAAHFPVGTPVKMTLSTASADQDDDAETADVHVSSSIGAGYAKGTIKGS
jgi:hypothetical protein